MSQYLVAIEVAERMLKAGVGKDDLLITIASACLRESVRAEGYSTAFRGDNESSTAARVWVGEMLWRNVERVDPRYDLERHEGRIGFEIVASWRRGEFGWTHASETEPPMGEMFSNVLFERASFEAWLARHEAKLRASEVVSDKETLDWASEWYAKKLEAGNPTRAKIAMIAYKEKFGARALAPKAFASLYKRVTGQRRRGRPLKIK